ncbi:ankyrin [Coprinopsis marcescibilis]|uniref:Ankyrin n=1 Tax=Coprinopsis marcescibilis TaxID=230819 RepID=A0A5C3K913_COPMA|nr:ankyrin [Coprinopsis marcescibilis]
MTIDDLRHALAFDPVRSKYDPELLVDADSLVSVCCGLITLEPQSKLVRLVHYTAKDFLKPYLRKDYPEPHSLISSSCVARMIYCGLHDMQDGIWSLYSSIPFYGNPFLGYSHSRWALHSHLCASIPPATVDLILQCRNFPIFHREDLLLDSGSSAHVAAAYGFPSLLREWFDQSHSGSLALPHNLDVNARTRDGFTPLWLASHFGHIEVVNILLDAEGIDVCCPNNHKVTPLMTASGNGHLKIVQLFLGVVDIEHVNATNKTSCSALIYASHSGRMEVVRAILGFQSTRNRCNTTLDNTVRVNDGISYGSGININGASNIGWTALIHAARQDHPGVVKELLRVKDISVNPHNSGMGRTLLYWALNKGYMDIAELLRSRGAHNGDVVTWVSEINYQDIQDDNLSKQIGETSMWVLDEPVFIDWAASDGGMLWGTGIPGAGKTVLASIVINHLRKRAKDNKRILVAFAFCWYTDSLLIRAILTAIVRQILKDYPSTIVFVTPLYKKHNLRKTSPTEAELVEVLGVIFTSDMFDKRFLFVDGLDEATSETQFDILDTLSNLPLNVLFTSRPLSLLKDVVLEARFFDIIVHNADIK